MNLLHTEIPDVVVLKPKVIGDTRGFFTEVYKKNRYATAGIVYNFVQDNLSRSSLGVLRGLHFQNPKAQGKLVTVLRGRIIDVAVDVRVGSPTFAKHVKIELDDQSRSQLWVPPGFAHGFVVLSETADVFYKCSNFYDPTCEIILRWNDPQLGIEWPDIDLIISERDSGGLTLSQLRHRLPAYGRG
jgi:dTDP-4-dehydrorhamnose 3,5-epimerase